MKRLRGCLTVLFLFGCGFLVGAFFGALFGWTSLFNKIVKSGPWAVQQVIIERVRNDLRLKGDARGEARQIVQDAALKLEAATAEARPKVAEILGRAEERLMALAEKEEDRRRLQRTLDQARRRWQPATPAPATPEPGATPSPAEKPER